MPSAGSGPKPKIRTGETTSRIGTPAVTTPAGSAMLPVPRSTLASAFSSHRKTTPPNTTSEYASAVSSAAPWPPIAV